MKKLIILFLTVFTVTTYGQNTDTQNTSQFNVIRNETATGGNTKVRIADAYEALNHSKVSRMEALVTTGTNDYTITADPLITSYSNGGKTLQLLVRFANANTGAVRVNINLIGLVALVKGNGSAYVGGEIVPGQMLWIAYTGSIFQTVDLGGGITNTAAANEIPKSDAVNFGSSGLYSLTPGNLDLGTTSLTGDRTISAKSSSASNSLYFQTTNGSSTATNALQLFISGTNTDIVAPPGKLKLISDTYLGRSLIGGPFGFDFINYPAGLSEVVATNNSSPNSVLLPFRIAATASAGTPANGFGVGMEFAAQNSANTNVVGSKITSVASDVTPGSEDFYHAISTMTNGSLTEKVRYTSLGEIGLGGANYGTAGQTIVSGGPGAAVTWGAGGGSGTVSTVSVVSANGLAGTVANPTTTPAITLSTTITGLVKGNGTAFSAASAGTDYSIGTSALTTGLLKSTTTTGALSIAVAGTEYQAPITFGTGVQTALGVNVGSAGAPVLFNGAGGTPTSLTLTNATGLSLTAGVTGILPVANGGTNASSASITAFNNITGYTTSGATGTTSTNLVFSASPTLTNPVVGTQSAADNSTKAASTAYVDALTVLTSGNIVVGNASNVATGTMASGVVTVNNAGVFSFGSNIATGSTASAIYRNTSAGGDVTSHFLIDPANSLTSGIAYTFDATNGFGFTQGNGTRRIQGAAIKPSGLTSTAGSEVMGLDFFTQSGGTAATSKMTLNGAGKLGIGGSPISTLDVFGSLGLKSNAISTDITLDATYYEVSVDASGGNRVETLPAAASSIGRVYIIKKSDSSVNSVTIDGNASETIDGATTKVVNTQYSGWQIKVNAAGTAWDITATF